MYENAARNLFQAPLDALDDKVVAHRNRELARAAWEDVRRHNPDAAYSADYARGFQNGYADFLDGGGRVVPPAVPPWHYRRAKYQTPAGHRAIEDWYAGHQHGVSAAWAWGGAQLRVLPSSGVMPKSGDARPRPAPPRPEPLPVAVEELPAPRPEMPTVPNGK
jgi:hypothetical protein